MTMTTTPRVVMRHELKENRDTPGIVRRVAFHTDTNALVEAHVDGGVASGWHHHGDRHVYANLLEGVAVIEYGAGGGDRLEINAGGFFYLPPGVVHRDVNPSDAPQRWIISFVGAGPLVTNVEGPPSA
jgi:uncharacterized RmlC-like cupin family protein